MRLDFVAVTGWWVSLVLIDGREQGGNINALKNMNIWPEV